LKTTTTTTKWKTTPEEKKWKMTSKKKGRRPQKNIMEDNLNKQTKMEDDLKKYINKLGLSCAKLR
jgi:hypothetical protein